MMEKKNKAYKAKNIINPKIRNTEKIIEKSASLVHEISNMLMPINSGLSIIKQKNIKDEILEKQINIMENCVQDLMKLTDNFKYYLKNFKDKEDVSIVDLDEIILEVFELAKNDYCCKINVKEGSKAKVLCNKTELREVFLNIIKNSYESLRGGEGIINILTGIVDNSVIIEIKDNGCGINMEEREKVFTPFYTSKRELGTGLGLSISREIILRLGGAIRFDSEEGKGSSIKITLPLYREKKASSKDELMLDKKILIIDDKPQIREVLSEMITYITGTKVDCCNGINFQSMVNREKYDIIISDMNMPVINGAEIANIVKAKNKGVYFVIMTGFDIGNEGGNLETVDSFISKPITKEKLMSIFIAYREWMYKSG